MNSYRYLHLDVFTSRRFEGNQLAVFPDGRGLDAAVMQQIANEMAFSETTFILPAEQPGTDVRMRIFTPTSELPMAGHPTVGSTFALAHLGTIAAGRDRFVFGLEVGPTPVTLEWEREGGPLAFAWMTQKAPQFGPTTGARDAVAAALGMEPGDIIADLPIQEVSCGVPFCFVPVASRAAVDRCTPEARPIAAALRSAGMAADGVFVFTMDAGSDDATVYSRMFAPGLGITEDPATGGASGPLGSYLVRYGLVPAARADAMLSLQGVRMGRPSRIHISIGVDSGREINRVQVGGTSVLVGEGTLEV